MTSQVQKQLPANWLKRFLIIWIGQAFSILGSRLVQFALVWWMTKETGSAVVLATSSTVTYLPQIFLGPFVGALVDRWNRRLVIIIADAAVAVATLVLAFLFLTGLIELWHIYALLFLRSLGGTFHWPAMQSSMSLLVPDKHLTRVAGFNQILDGGVNVLGPALGAILMEAMPIQGVLSIDVVTAMIAITPLLIIAIPQPVNESAVERITPRVVLKDVKEGFRYVAGWRGMLIILIFAMILNFLFAPTGTYLPLLVTDYFKGGVWHLGLIQSLSGAGMILGGLLLSVLGGFKRKVLNILVGMIVMGGTAVLVGVTPANLFILAAISYGIEGISNTFLNGGAFSLLQSLLRADMQGLVFGLISSATSICSPLGLLVSAPVVEKFGIQPWFIFCGIVSILMGLVSLMIPDVLKIEKVDADNSKQLLENSELEVVQAAE